MPSPDTSPGQLLASLRQSPPLVHCITNYVAMNTSANVLLALGASPAMVHAEQEVVEFTQLSSALSINIGTLSAPWAAAMQAAAEAANTAGRPWILDPVAIGATAYRQAFCAELLHQWPSVIRGNASEIIALSGQQSTGRGADSTATTEQAHAAACALARQQHCVVVVSGERDLITDGVRSLRINGGHSLMPRVTTLGCALSATVAAFAGVCPQQPLDASVAALGCFAVAGKQAGDSASGPGSYMPAFLDALYALAPADLDRHLSLESVDAC